MIFCYPHRSGPHSSTIRETFFCGLRITYRDPQLDNMQRVRELETLGSKWDVSNKPSPQSSGNPVEEEVERVPSPEEVSDSPVYGERASGTGV